MCFACSNGVPGAVNARRLRGRPANPLNLIRLVPAEGLDASHTAPSLSNEDKGGARCARRRFSPSPQASRRVAALPAASAADKTLTVYTYGSFTADWGPGPQVKKNFEAECGCTLKFVSVADGVALLNRLKLEGDKTEADIVLGLDNNLTWEARQTGLFAPSGVSLDNIDVPGGWTDDIFVPFDYGYFAVVYDTETITDPPTQHEGPGRRRSRPEDRHRGPAHLDAGARACCCGSRTSTATRPTTPGPG